MSLQLAKTAHEPAVAALLRLPSQRPQKGRQAVRDVTGEELWAGADADFERALAFTPGAFLWVRDRAHLVELPAIWVRVPLQQRDPHELAGAIVDALASEGCPAPHMVVEGDLHVVALWSIEPFRRPKKAAPDEHHFAFRKGLAAWRNCAMKLSFALEDLGALPLDVAAAEDLAHQLVPLPLPRTSPLRSISIGFDQDLPQLLTAPAPPSELHVVDVSRPLSRRHDKRLFAILGVQRPRSKKEWLKSAQSLAALSTTAVGERHPAAVKIACACVWDGRDYDATLAQLQAWAAGVEKDGQFPARRRKGNELELLASWAIAKLQPGGPNRPGAVDATAARTTRHHVAAAVVGFLRSVGGSWAGSKTELAKQAALWALEARIPAHAPRTTLKRALGDLKAAGELIHTVTRAGETWLSTWALQGLGPPATPAAAAAAVEISTTANSYEPRGQKGESTWAPGLPDFALTIGGGFAAGRLPPAGWVQGGENPQPAEPAPVVEADAGVASHDAEPTPTSPENDRRPRQRRLRLVDLNEPPRRRRRRRPETFLPPLDELATLVEDVGTKLKPAKRKALLEQAYSDLRDRPAVRADAGGALRKRMLRLLRRRGADFVDVAPESVIEERDRLEREATAAAVAAAAAERKQPAAQALADFKRMLSLAGVPLHLRQLEDRVRRLHDEGLSLVPLRPNTKEPAITWTRWQSEQTPLSLLRRHLQALGDDAGVAILCGPVSGLVVVDLDDDDAVKWAQRYLPETPWRTKTRRGEHWFYRHPSTPLPSTAPPWTGQLQGAGRYVVAPGSKHPEGGTYEALGDWGQPKSQLPLFDERWLLDVDALRAAREKILRGDS